MDRFLERCIRMRRSPRAVVRLAGKIGTVLVILRSRSIEREVKDLELDSSVINNKAEIRDRILAQKELQ